MGYKYVFLYGVAFLCVGAWLNDKYAPVQSVNNEVLKENVVTVIKTVKQPNGTEVTETKITDKSVKAVTVTAATPKPNWFVQAGYDINKQYSAQISRRVLMNVFVGVQASTAGNVGVVVGVEF